jgi:phosphatidylglycerol:prolipoprotein diacylglycerol transferase
MYPILFSVGPISFYSYGILVSIGFFVSVLLLIRLVERASLNLQFLADHFFSLLVFSIVGARFFYIVLFWEEYSFDLWRMFYFWEGGFLVWGGIIFFLILFSYYCRKSKENFPGWLTVLLPPAILWALFESIGSFLDGKNFGVQTSLPWGVQFDNPAMPFAGVSVHPTQLYTAFFLILFYLWLKFKWREGKKTISPSFGYVGVFIYALFQFIIDFLHGDFVPYFFGLRVTQILALLVAIFFLILYLLDRSSKRQV